MGIVASLKKLFLGIEPSTDLSNNLPSAKPTQQTKRYTCHMGIVALFKKLFLGIESPVDLSDNLPSEKPTQQPNGHTCPECGTKDILVDECPNCSTSLLNFYDVCPYCSSMVSPEQTVCGFCENVIREPISSENLVLHAPIITENIARVLSFNITDILKNSLWIFNKRPSIFLFIALLYFSFQIVFYYWSIGLSKHTPLLFKIFYELGGIFFSMLVKAIFIVFIAFASYRIISSREASFGNALKWSFSKLDAAFWTSALKGIIILGLTLCFVIPGIIWMVYYAFAMQVVAFSNLKKKAALDYSEALVEKQWWKVFGYFLVFGTISALPYAVFSVLSVFVRENTIMKITEIGFSALFSCLFAITMTVLFFNLDYMYHSNKLPLLKQEEF